MDSLSLTVFLLVVTLSLTVSMPQSNTSGSANISKRRVSPNGLNINNPSQLKSFELNHNLHKWISSSLKFFDFHRCTLSNIGSEDECFKLSQLRRSQIAVYFAHNRNQDNSSDILTTKRSLSVSSKSGSGNSNTGPSVNSVKGQSGSGDVSGINTKVYAILPDSNIPKSSGPHDAILVLDPYPLTNFGHLVALFYIDFGYDVKTCKEEYQILTSDNSCITVGRKPRCPNLLERFTTSLHPKRCHIDFLPTVYPSSRVNLPPLLSLQQSHLPPDLLQCLPLHGFAPCPKLRPLEETTKVLCDSSESNSKRCDTSHTGVGTSCKLFQTCDRAVLLGGGWNRLHSGSQSLQNIFVMENALKSSGFLVENIKTFYANGKATQQAPNSGNMGRRSPDSYNFAHSQKAQGDYFSSAMKTGLRGHLRALCETRHCADSLFIYLNNPTTFEGDMLLWDVDYNGIADELEVYSVKEFLSDLAGCEAKRILVLVDQTNSDILMSSLKTSTEHQNVIILTAGLPNELPLNGEFTSNWANNSNPVSCLSHVQQTTTTQMNNSNPVFYDPTHSLFSKVSLIGAPCDLNPPVNSRELKTLYQGCQNVPTSIWFSFDFEDIGEIGGEEEEESEKNGSQETSGGGVGGVNEDTSDRDTVEIGNNSENVNVHTRPGPTRPRRRRTRKTSKSKDT